MADKSRESGSDRGVPGTAGGWFGLSEGQDVHSEVMQAVKEAILDTGWAEKIIHLRAVLLPQEELMIGAKIAFPEKSSLKEISRNSNEIKSRLRQLFPEAKAIYIEPDIFSQARDQKAPITEAIVIRSYD